MCDHAEALGCQCSGSEKWFIFGIFLLILNYFTSFSIQKDKVKIKYKPNLLISGGEVNTEIKRNWFFSSIIMMYINPWLENRWNCKYPGSRGKIFWAESGISTFLENIAENMFIYMQINPFGTKLSPP